MHFYLIMKVYCSYKFYLETLHAQMCVPINYEVFTVTETIHKDALHHCFLSTLWGLEYGIYQEIATKDQIYVLLLCSSQMSLAKVLYITAQYVCMDSYVWHINCRMSTAAISTAYICCPTLMYSPISILMFCV